MILSSILRLIREYIRYNTFIQNPNPRPDPRIFKKIRPNPSAFKILRSVTTLLPADILCARSLDTFKKRLKSHLFYAIYELYQLFYL